MKQGLQAWSSAGRWLLPLAMLVWLGGLSLSAHAVLPTADLLRNSLAGLGERKLPEAEQQAAQQALEQTLAWLESAEQTATSLQQLEEQVRMAPEQIRSNRQTLARLLQEAERRQLPAGLDLAALEALVIEQSRELADWQADLNEANAAIVRSQTRPERAQSEISTNQRRLQEISTQLKAAKEGGKPLLSSERLDALRAEQEVLQLRNRLRQAELANNSVLQDLASSARELLATKVQAREDYLATLQGLLSEKRQAASELTVQEQSLEVEKAGEDTLLLKESSLNLQLSDYLLAITERRNQLAKKSLEVRQQLDSVQQAEQAMEEQIAALQGSVLLAKILYQQKQALPKPSFDRTLADQIADTRLYQFQLRQYRDSMHNPDAYIDGLLKDREADTQLREAMQELMRLRADLLERLGHELNAYLSEAISVQLNQKQLQSLSLQLRTLLDEQMFWIPSNRPLDRDWFKQLPSRLKKQWRGLDAAVVPAELWPLWRGNWLAFVPALLISLAVLWKRRALYGSIEQARPRIGHYLHDRQRFTPVAVGAVLLLSLPAFFWFSTAGWLAQLHTHGVAYEFGTALLHTAKLGLVFAVAYRLLCRDGVVMLHFGWSAEQVRFLRKRLAWVALVVWLLAMVVPLAQANLSALSNDVLGVVVLALGLLLLGSLLVNAALQQFGGENLPLFGKLLALVLGAAPFLLILALGAGYYYTVLQMSERLLMTLAVLIIWVLVRATIERGLGIAARRLAWERVEQARRTGEEADSTAEQHALGISDVNEQSLRLLRLLLVLGLGASLYWIWADVISLFSYLDNVVLYEDAIAPGGLDSPVAAVSLNDLLNALLIVGMTIMLARNLPGLMEVLFLSRMQLAPGTSYATMRLLSYSISSIGIVATLAALGVSWNKLQWLVAALSVGLGFGLQEIFANFISGLIVLFERPVRIGDMVTIGEMTGTVSRIRIRATTITELDRKESIIPNKVFVTERLLNWSLSDCVTRITLHIRLGHDADLEQARSIMLQCMQENYRVLEDPEPVVLFLEAGLSSFNHEMRYHVGEISDRNTSIDEIHNRLVERFRDAGIRMAFQQLDVHVKAAGGQEVSWSDQTVPSA